MPEEPSWSAAAVLLITDLDVADVDPSFTDDVPGCRTLRPRPDVGRRRRRFPSRHRGKRLYGATKLLVRGARATDFGGKGRTLSLIRCGVRCGERHPGTVCRVDMESELVYLDNIDF
jgi:hypothetical protein